MTDIPLFPLNTVLFPGGVLPLRIFEPRYVDMIRHCMRAGSTFGVVLIREGAEAGVHTRSHDIGTLASIVDFDQLPDGLLGITVRGTQRFKVIDSHVKDDGLNVAQIELLAEEVKLELPEQWKVFAQMLEQALPQMGAFFKHLQPQYGDAAWVAARLAEILPMSLLEKQRLLEVDDPLERLHILEPHVNAHSD